MPGDIWNLVSRSMDAFTCRYRPTNAGSAPLIPNSRIYNPDTTLPLFASCLLSFPANSKQSRGTYVNLRHKLTRPTAAHSKPRSKTPLGAHALQPHHHECLLYDAVSVAAAHSPCAPCTPTDTAVSSQRNLSTRHTTAQKTCCGTRTLGYPRRDRCRRGKAR